MSMKKMNGLFALLIGIGIYLFWAVALEAPTSGEMIDFQDVYYGARCALQHHDPYNENEMSRVYSAEKRVQSPDPLERDLEQQHVVGQVYPPPTFLCTVPFAVLPWESAHRLWKILTAGLFILSACLVWNLAASDAPGVAGCLIGFMLASSEILIASGNLAGIAVSLCVLAVWSFVQERFVPAGILCLAISLSIKPHDAGLVWLYFLLAGGTYRKRAMQSLAAFAVICVPSVIWITRISPSWMRELLSNLSKASVPGGLSDPRTANLTSGMIIDLQALISVFWNNPFAFNLMSYLICGALLFVLSLKAMRSRSTSHDVWLALAAIAPLSMLPTYHRPYDARLLLLTLPACAILWTEGGIIAKFALWVNAAAIVFSSDVPWITVLLLSSNPHLGPATQAGKMMLVGLTRPAPAALLVLAIFYLWVYVRRTPRAMTPAIAGGSNAIPNAPTAT